MMFWLTTYPIDVVKSSLQADHPDPAQRKYKGFMDAVRQIQRSQGTAGFFRGFAPCMLRSFPANAVCFLAYEQAKQLIG